MKEVALAWISAIVFLVFFYFVVKDPAGTAKIIGSLSSGNTNAILALQGRNPTGF